MKIPLSNLSPQEIQDNYGHGYSEGIIIKQFPYDDRDFNKAAYSKLDCTLTYDPLTAMSLRLKNTPILVWGQRYKGQRAFVFQKSRPKTITF